ncbi:hypothetical protein LDENG_00103850 [Lucifuga dentata]|nr:hypothetical protein LDENG_00103850 [Lucifuga dentata]
MDLCNAAFLLAALISTETAFTCRAFMYAVKDQECWTTSENSNTESVLHRPNAALYEHKGFLLECLNGKTCQSWTANDPASLIYTLQSHPYAGLESNYCRNPDEDSGGPWCYTTDPNTRWESCDIPSCTEECFHCTGEEYQGKISTTEGGLTCQRWDSQTPHEHSYSPKARPGKHLEENYCRNPSGASRPWCYTTNPSKQWDFCSIPRCTSEPPTIVPELTCITGAGSAYRGTVAVTQSGKTCQSWSAQTPHKHDRTADNYPCSGLEKNYCRNPDNEKKPWCYTMDSGTRWEYCNVPSCGETAAPEECFHCRGEDYQGKVSKTEGGLTCQRWDSQTPHKHSNSPNARPGKHLEENYCRNPDGSARPWCYTTNPSKRWEYCPVPRCTSEPPTIVPELTCITGAGSAYRGTVAVTQSGKTCQSWSAQTPHKHDRTADNYPCSGLEKNYCRNPDNEKKPWCYTTDSGTRWEYCNVPSCGDAAAPEECFHCRGEDYQGKVSKTEGGLTCQRWDSQTPYEHSNSPSAHPGKHLEENYCRNPDGSARPWCYTTNPSKRWEYCPVPRCSKLSVQSLHCTEIIY